MEIPKDLPGLADLFRRLGARDPEAWASSQVSEGIEQLHRFLFLREAWRKVVPGGDSRWIAANVAEAELSPHAPFSGVGLALQRCLDKGVDERDLTEIVRGMQVELLFSLCYMLEDPGLEETELRELGWCLVVADEGSGPTRRVIRGLHESVLEQDPTGREMRPE